MVLDFGRWEIFYFKMTKACKDTTTTTRMTNLNAQIVFASLEKRNNRTKWGVFFFTNRGISKPLFRPSKSEAVNSDIYLNECLEKRLVPFICEHRSDSNYFFWPDLAGCHYSKHTIAWKMSTLCPKRLIHQMFPMHVLLRIFGDVCHKKFTREAGRLKRSSS